MEAAKAEVVNLIKRYNAKKILDIATGRGMLLTKLAKSCGSYIDLVCVDLSFEVLKYNRIKALSLNPDMKINFIACDATKLPFLSDGFDLAVSLVGIQNMGNFASQGISEAVRVSQKGLVNVGLIIRDDNPKIDELNKLLMDNGYDFKVDSFTESNFYKLHAAAGKHKVDVDNVFEGIAEKNENDMIPIEGEWFAAAISRTTKEPSVV
jgi:ubiquinone/menaquinone biosynthesis C-methylase UbiE